MGFFRAPVAGETEAAGGLQVEVLRGQHRWGPPTSSTGRVSSRQSPVRSTKAVAEPRPQWGSFPPFENLSQTRAVLADGPQPPESPPRPPTTCLPPHTCLPGQTLLPGPPRPLQGPSSVRSVFLFILCKQHRHDGM